MSVLVVCSIFLAALVVSVIRSPRSSFGWVYLPTVILVPSAIAILVSSIPDLSVRRVALLGLALGAMLTGRSAQLVPRWRWLDLLPMAAVLSFSISHGLTDGFKGFYSRLAMLGMDWGLPYVFARALLDDARHTRNVLLPLVISLALLAFMAVYEGRMGYRLGAELWYRLAGTEIPDHWGGGAAYRWGFLRAYATTGHPILLGTIFATGAPLAVLWGLLRRGSRVPAFSVAVACAVGCVATISRGPLLILLACASIFTLIGYRVRSLGILIAVMLALASPFAWEAFNETVEETRQDLIEGEAIDSPHYRIVLLLLYAKQDFGFWGNPRIVGVEYESTWSIDNAYLFLFITGGWCGGTLIIAMVVAWAALGWRAITSARGRKRKILSASLASFACVAGSMADVWFAPDYWPFFFVVGALVINQSRSTWFAGRGAHSTPMSRRTQQSEPRSRGVRASDEALGTSRVSSMARLLC
jgi:hypothetical protein